MMTHHWPRKVVGLFLRSIIEFNLCKARIQKLKKEQRRMEERDHTLPMSSDLHLSNFKSTYKIHFSSMLFHPTLLKLLQLCTQLKSAVEFHR